MSGNKKQEKISKVTLDYLRKRPNAGDTIEGITKWWLERGSKAPGRRIGANELAYDADASPSALRFRGYESEERLKL